MADDSDTSTVTLVKYGRNGAGRETETALLTADNLSVFRDGKGLVLSLHRYHEDTGKPIETYRMRLGEEDASRLRTLV